MATKGNGAPAMQKRLVLGVNAKGGVGKSRWMIGYVDHVRRAGQRIAAWDADGAVGSLLLTLGQRDAQRRLVEDQDPLAGIAAYDVRSETDRLRLVESLEGTDAPIVAHDLAGGSVEELARINTPNLGSDDDVAEGISLLLDGVERRGYRTTLVHVLSPNVAAASSVKRYLELFGARADHVVVLNRFWGREFPYWTGFTDGLGVQKGGATRARLMELGGIEIEMPALPAVTAAKIEAEAVPPSIAQEDARFRAAEQDHCRNFVRLNGEQLAKAGRYLGLTP